MMFPDTTNDQQSAALRQAAERSSAASNSQYEYAYSTWNPMPPKREKFTPSSHPIPIHSNSTGEALRSISR
jgi:hypothetical protein